jgi:hypothetical protein
MKLKQIMEFATSPDLILVALGATFIIIFSLTVFLEASTPVQQNNQPYAHAVIAANHWNASHVYEGILCANTFDITNCTPLVNPIAGGYCPNVPDSITTLSCALAKSV